MHPFSFALTCTVGGKMRGIMRGPERGLATRPHNYTETKKIEVANICDLQFSFFICSITRYSVWFSINKKYYKINTSYLAIGLSDLRRREERSTFLISYISVRQEILRHFLNVRSCMSFVLENYRLLYSLCHFLRTFHTLVCREVPLGFYQAPINMSLLIFLLQLTLP